MRNNQMEILEMKSMMMEMKISPGKINRISEIAEESHSALFHRSGIQPGEQRNKDGKKMNKISQIC